MSACLTWFSREIRFFAWRYPEHTNFGDELSRVIVEWVSGRQVRLVPGDDGNKLIAIGTLLEDWARDGDVVWGVGSRCIRPENIVGKKLDVRMVRGPLTRDFLLNHGIDCPAVYGDPGMLMSRVYPVRLKPPAERQHDVGVLISVLDSPEAPRSGHAIDVRRPWREVIAALAECRRVVSSSLHGIIVAEAYGIPAVWMRSLDEMSVKYRDYYLSTGREVDPADTMKEALTREPPPLPAVDLSAMLAAFPRHLLSRHRRSAMDDAG
jgi:pyruvyltransferase